MQHINSSAYYKRQLILSEFGYERQELLTKSTVLVVGAGGLGCPALISLVCAGVGKIVIADGDRIQLSNLHRQTLFTIDDIGQPKAETAAKELKRHNPYIEIEFVNGFLKSENISKLIENVDVVLDCTDNFEVRFLLGDETAKRSIPLIFSAIFGFEGQLSVFNYNDGAVFRDLFPTLPSASSTPNCATNGVIGFVPTLMGTLQAAEAIKMITNLGDVCYNKLLQINLITLEKHEFAITKREHKIVNIHSNNSSKNLNCKTMNIKEITSKELYQMRSTNSENLFLLDVRELFEWSEFNIGGNHIPMQDIIKNLAVIPRDKTVVVICRSGARSANVTNYLVNQHQFPDVVNLAGGLIGWRNEIGE